MEVAKADPAWKEAELGVVAQIGAWYMPLGGQLVGHLGLFSCYVRRYRASKDQRLIQYTV